MTCVHKYANMRQRRAAPETKVVFYKEEKSVPALEWLDSLPVKAQLKCVARIERLKQEGHALRRPEADLLRDRIDELRVGLQGIHYRLLYFFHGNVAAVLAHGIVKESAVPPAEIDRAIERRKKYEQNPEKHTHEE